MNDHTPRNDPAITSNSSVTVRARAYAELVRVPNLFTAPPDVILGAALASLYVDRVSHSAVAGLAVASMALYAGGTTLNDAFDVPIDVRERPERPIPSGRVSRRSAFALGVAFLGVGVVISALTAGTAGGVMAVLVALAIVAYDGVTKNTAAGSLTMGATRGLNVVLGTTAAGAVVLEFPLEALVVPVAITAYVATITHMASTEVSGGDSEAVVTVAVGALFATLVLGWHLFEVDPHGLETALALVLMGAFLVWIGRPLAAAYGDPTPEHVGPAVGACVLGLVILDAAIAIVAGIAWGFTALAFLAPAVGLARAFDVT